MTIRAGERWAKALAPPPSSSPARRSAPELDNPVGADLQVATYVREN